MLLAHKKAVIYGAAGAIGGAVARTVAHEGADLFLAGRTRAAGGVAEAAEFDALDEDAIEKHRDDVVARAQRIASCSTPLAWTTSRGPCSSTCPLRTSRSRSSRLRGPSSSPRARRRGGWSGKAPG